VGRTSWSAADLPVGLYREFNPSAHYLSVTFYRRRLPHLYEINQPVFLTWRLYDTLPRHRVFPKVATLSSGAAFATMDRLLDETRTGSFYLRQPAIADMVVAAFHHSARVLRHQTLHAFVVMPNHVHLLISPQVPLPQLTKALKNYTAKRANEMLWRSGSSFWQEESYDHLVRGSAEGEHIQRYIEQNPVRAGLVKRANEYRWSSAGWATGWSPADQRSAPRIMA
jgi:putative transposase